MSSRRIVSLCQAIHLNRSSEIPRPSLIARISETDTIRAFLVGTTTGVFLDLIFVFIYIAVLFTLSVELTLIILAALPIQILIYLGFGPFLRRRLRVQFDAGAAHQTQMVENISGIASVKALSAEGKMLERLDETLHANLNAGYRVGLLNIWNDKLLFIVDKAITILTEDMALPDMEKVSELRIVNVIKKRRVGDNGINCAVLNVDRTGITARQVDALALFNRLLKTALSTLFG